MQRAADAGLATSLVFHALAVAALSHVALQTSRHAPEPARPNVVWLGGWAEHEARGAQEGTGAVDSELAAPAEGAAAANVLPERPPRTIEPRAPDEAPREAPAPAGPPAAPGTSTAESPQNAPSGPGVALDWSEQRRRAIESMLDDGDRAASYRSFSFPGTVREEQAAAVREAERRLEAGLKPERTVFDSPSKGRAGLTDGTVLGEHIVWVSDECYARYGSNNLFLLPSAAAMFQVPTTICVSVNPRDDLFWNAKPRYRMTAAEQQERARRLALRDDTGVFASLGD